MKNQKIKPEVQLSFLEKIIKGYYKNKMEYKSLTGVFRFLERNHIETISEMTQ